MVQLLASSRKKRMANARSNNATLTPMSKVAKNITAARVEDTRMVCFSTNSIESSFLINLK